MFLGGLVNLMKSGIIWEGSFNGVLSRLNWPVGIFIGDLLGYAN